MAVEYEALSPGGHANLVSDIKEYVAASKPKETVTDGTVDTDTFISRVTARGFPVGSIATVRAIKGSTLVWNQMNDNSTSTRTINDVLFTNNGDGSWTINGTASDAIAMAPGGSVSRNHTHKYLLKGCPAGGSPSTYMFGVAGSADDFGNGAIYTPVVDTDALLYFIIRSGVTMDNVLFWPQFFDLTRMFGSGNEPSTVAEFERMYPASYYAYDSGTVKPASVSGIKAVGFNAWDEQWEIGGYANANGSPWNTNDRIRSKNAIRIFPGTTYHMESVKGSEASVSAMFNVYYYDADDNYLGSEYTRNVVNKHGSQTYDFTTPANAHFMRFATQPVYGTTYNHDICINISDPALNGTYKPYTSDTLALDIPPLHGIGTACDEQRETERVTRIGSVDLGTLGWRLSTTVAQTGKPIFWASLSSSKNYTGGSTVPNMCCANYSTVQLSDISQLSTDDVMSGGAYYTGGPNVYICDSTYSDATTFASAMSGVYLYYELATPVTTPTDPPLLMQYDVESGGSETVQTTGISAPPTLEIEYSIESADVASSVAPSESLVSSANYAVGSMVMLGGTLVKVTSAIASGETFQVGTNCTRTTLAAELAAAE